MNFGSILSKLPVVHLLDGIRRGFAEMATVEKIQKVMMKIGTHSGQFHCDEALACFMLKQLPEYEDAEIVRTRDEEILQTCDIVVDVGAVYDHESKRYDHHQRTFNQTFSSILPHFAKDKSIVLSSAGLVYCHYGLQVISKVLQKHQINLTSECISKIFLHVYENFVEELDAIDNGVSMHEGLAKYKINTHLSSRVARLNPVWNAENQVHPDKLFRKAMELVGDEFTEQVMVAATVWWPAREIVKNAILERAKLHPSGKIIELSRFCPWKEHLMAIEEELGIKGEITFILFTDQNNAWRVQAVPIQPESFVCRVFLHQDWRGLRDETLSKAADIEGCVFCHASGFIGGNKSKAGALQMAVKSLLIVHD